MWQTVITTEYVKLLQDREVISIAGGSGIGFVNGNSDSAKFNEPGDVVRVQMEIYMSLRLEIMLSVKLLQMGM